MRVVKPVEPGVYDKLNCDKLTLTFEPAEQIPPVAEKKSGGKKNSNDGKKSLAAKTAAPEDKERTGFQGIAGNLEFRRLLAEGKKVVLTSQANDLRADMKKLDYDAETRVAVLSGKKGAGAGKMVRYA